MTITQSQGTRNIPLVVAQHMIKRIIDRNPAIRDAVDKLVNQSNAPTVADKRNESIHKVYLANPVFAEEVDEWLDQL